MLKTSTDQLMLHSPIIELPPILGGEQIHGNYIPPTTIGVPYMMSPPFFSTFCNKGKCTARKLLHLKLPCI